MNELAKALGPKIREAHDRRMQQEICNRESGFARNPDWIMSEVHYKPI